MRYFFIFLLFIFTIASCTSKYEIDKNKDVLAICDKECQKLNFTIRIDSSFTAIQQEQIHQSVFDWSLATGETIDPKFIITNELVDELRSATINIYIKSVPEGYWGWAYWDVNTKSAQIHVLNNITDKEFALIIKHELGHAFNLFHYDDDPKSIMNAYLAGDEEITCHDVIEYCKQWNCVVNCNLTSGQKLNKESMAFRHNMCAIH